MLVPIFKATMRTSAISLDRTKRSRWCRLSDGWLPNVNASFEIIIKNSNIIGVSVFLIESQTLCTDLGYLTDISTQGKSDRAISPNAMNEEDRRELIARQHRALYGNDGGSFYESGNFGDDAHTPRPSTQPSGNSTSAGGAQGSSPNTFGVNQNQAPSSLTETTGHISADQTQPNAPKGSSPIPQQPRSRANSTSSPASNPQNFSLFESTNQQSSRTSTSSPGGSPPRQTKSATAPIGSGVGPIGTRPTGQGINPALSKRSTTPLPSPLSYGFAPNESLNANSGNERSTSAASNTSATVKDANMGSMAWGNSGGVWGKNSLSVQASVWG